MNVVAITGRLVYEPEPKMTQSGYTMLSTRIAVSRNDKNRTTDFFNVKAWNGTAKFIGQYFHKGDPIEIKGKLQTDTYEKHDGTTTTDTYINVDDVSFVLRTNDRPVSDQVSTSIEPSEAVAELIEAPTEPVSVPAEEDPTVGLPFEV